MPLPAEYSPIEKLLCLVWFSFILRVVAKKSPQPSPIPVISRK